MAKKIGFIIFSVTIILIGYIAFNRLNYWDRSVRIFNLNNEQTSGRGFDRGRSNVDRNENRERPDRRGFQNILDSNLSTDSLRQNRERVLSTNRNNLRDENFNRNRQGRGNLRRGKNVQLSNVSRFFAVFALFTVLTIFLDKGNNIIRKKKKPTRQKKS